MIVLLTGGIGCGKSSVSRMLQDLGAETHDADAIVHALYERADVQQRVAALVGLTVPFTRADVARHVFGDDAMLRRLEAIIHPLVHERFDQLRAETAPEQVHVFEFPLPPTPVAGDVVLCVECDEGVRMQRLRDRGMQDADAYARIAAAPGPMAYREHAQRVIVNNGTLEDLQAQVQEFWEELGGAS